MFRKLLSNLPFNPSLINQVSFYAQRVRSESSVRRSGLILMVLALLLQMFAVVAPPQASLLASDNDIIPGGFTSQKTAIDYCETNKYNFRNILHRFDADCDSVRNATPGVKLRSTDTSYGGTLLSIGRLPYNKPGERAITDVYGQTDPLYLRPLKSWDTGPYSTYTALVGKNTKGQWFMVLYDCGNVVAVESQPTVPPAPAPTPKKPIVEIVEKKTLPGTPKAGETVTKGDVLGYRIYFRNRGDAAATNVFVEDETSSGSFVKGSQGSGKADRYDYVDTPFPGSNGATPHVYWAYYNFPAGATGYYVDFKVTVNGGHKDGDQICNRAYIRSNQTAQSYSNKVCHTYKATRTRQPVETPRDDSPPPGVPNQPIVVIEPTPTKPCDRSADIHDVASCLELHKTAVNETQNVIDANNTTAKPGDVITYSLTTRNYSNQDLTNYVIKENLADVMEYTDKVIDFNGASMDDKKVVTWPATTIKAGETVTKKITIRIKSDIPNTPSPPGNPGSFDLMLTNVYGDAVNIKLPGSVAKAVAVVNSTLPNTGPGTTVTIAVLFTMAAGYFFARSRLMAKELDLVRIDYATSGGQ